MNKPRRDSLHLYNGPSHIWGLGLQDRLPPERRDDLSQTTGLRLSKCHQGGPILVPRHHHSRFSPINESPYAIHLEIIISNYPIF
jgi:hypothetical protein